MAYLRLTKAQQTTLLTEIYELLSARTPQNELFEEIQKTWPMSRNTLFKYYCEAQKWYNNDQKSLNDYKHTLKINEAEEAFKAAKWSEDEIITRLQDLIKKTKSDQVKINGYNLLCKIQGYQAPERQQIEIAATPIFPDNPLLGNLASNGEFIDITPEEPDNEPTDEK